MFQRRLTSSKIEIYVTVHVMDVSEMFQRRLISPKIEIIVTVHVMDV